MTVRVMVCTGVLTLLIAVMGGGMTGVLMRIVGLETATPTEAMLVCAALCVLLAPVVLGPLVSFAFRWRALRDRLEAAALTDPLTGIPNRRAFFEHLASWLGPDGPAQHFALLMVDVDHFKRINDRLGHKAGDVALAFVAGRIRDALARAGEPDALVARMGGEEFAVFLAGVQAGGAGRAAQAVCGGVRAGAFSYEGTRLNLTVSVGAWAGASADVDGPLAQADRAAYAAKAAGRDCWAMAGEVGTPAPAVADGAPRAA